MNKKTLIILVVLLIILIGFVLGYFLIFKKTPAQQAQNEIEKDGFIVELPEGWVEVEAVSGSSATAAKREEQFTDQNAQKIGFKSYYSVVHDVLSEEKIEDYLQKIKDSLVQGFPDVKLSDSENKASDGSTIYYIEADLNQQDIDFKALLAVHIKDSDVWIISFNTLKENWEAYRNSFYQIAENFKIK